MTTDEIVAARVRKYTADLANHPAPSQPDGNCRCPACIGNRAILAELGYIQMAARLYAPRPYSSDICQKD
jgi:hypothetical protein